MIPRYVQSKPRAEYHEAMLIVKTRPTAVAATTLLFRSMSTLTSETSPLGDLGTFLTRRQTRGHRLVGIVVKEK